SPYKEHPVNTQRNTQGRGGRSATVAEQAEQIYQAYPIKVGRKKALEAITKALKECPFEQLLESVQEFAAAVDGTPDRSKIKHPATWFNQGCWDDDRSVWPTIGRDRR